MTDDTGSHDPRLQTIISKYLQTIESGRELSRQKFVQENSDLATELTAFFVEQDRTRSADAEETKPVAANALSPTVSLGVSATGDPNVAASPEREAQTLLPSGSPTPPASTDLPLGGPIRHFGDYELLERIGRGGMGVVFRARQISLDRCVALKMILSGELASEAEVERFHTEAAAAAELDHPGIVPIFEVGERDGQHFFSMGYVEGQSLAERIADGPLPPRDAAEVADKLASAVAFAHKHGVIHRDIKPDNVLLDGSGQPRITDFGLAKKLEGDSHQTRTGEILGTPSYMPPEQAAGKTHEIGPAADIYALGAVLYAMLTGRPPFQAANPVDTLLQVMDKEPIAPRQLDVGIPRDLETICLKCLQKDVLKRYSTAEELAADLQRFSDGQPIEARPVGMLERGWLWCKRNPWIAVPSAAAALLALVLMIGGPLATALVYQQKQRAVEQRELAVDTLRLLVDEVHTELKTRPNMQPVTKAVVQLAMDGLQEVANKNEDYGRTDIGIASAFKKFGEVSLELGDTQKALQQYKESLKIAQQLEAEGLLPDPHFNLAGIYERLGRTKKYAGKLAEAKQYFLTALEHWEQRRLEYPGEELRHLKEMAKMHGQLGSLANMRGDPAETRDYYAKSLELRQQWVALEPDNLAAQSQLAGALRSMRFTAVNAGDLPGAERYQLEGIRLLEKLATLQPDKVAHRANVGRFYSELGDFTLMNDQPAKAKEYFQKAVATLRRLSESDPKNARLKDYLAHAYYGFGNACYELKEVTSKEYFRQGREIRQTMFDADPTSRPKKVKLMLALARCGEHLQAATYADQLRENSPSQKELYDIAGCYAQCAVAAEMEVGETETDSQPLSDRYRQSAISALQAAVDHGFAAAQVMRRDPDLAPLRQRSEFLAILLQLEENAASSE